MPEIKNNFLQGKMNKDLDDRLLPNGQYRDAQNINISKSENSDVGTVQNIKANKYAYTATPLNLASGIETIGYFVDEVNNDIFWFVTNFTGSTSDKSFDITYAGEYLDPPTNSEATKCAIYYWNANQPGTQPQAILDSYRLNFSKIHPILHINKVDDLLFWTDNYNQPRRINVRDAIDANYYTNNIYLEDKISVAQYAPPSSPKVILSNDSTVKSKHIENKFVKFAYRFKYQNNEYSLISPFTQTCFHPGKGKTFQYGGFANGSAGMITSAEETAILKNTTVESMQNLANRVYLNIDMPSHDDIDNIGAADANGILSGSGPHTINNINSGGSNPAATNKIITERGDNFTVSSFSDPNLSLSETISDAIVDDTRLYIFNNNDLTTYNNPLDIKKIEILYVESDSPAVQVVDIIELDGATTYSYRAQPLSGDSAKLVHTYQYVYNSSKPIRTLAESEIIRVGDIIPVKAHAQEVSGNRVIYGNFKQNRTLDNAIEKNYFSVTNGTQGKFNDEYLLSSVKSRREYSVGLVLSDRYGRQSTVFLPNTSTTYVEPYDNTPDPVTQGTSSWKHEVLKLDFTQKIDDVYNPTTNPLGWYSYRVVVKQSELEYYNAYTPTLLDNVPSTNPRSWLVLHGDNINKIPRDVTDINTETGAQGSQTKLLPRILNTTGTQTQQYTNDFIDITSIGTALEQGLNDAVNGHGGDATDALQELYNYDKNPLLAEIEDGKGIDWTGGVNTSILNVFETEPFKSSLDIYYETSTAGLVSHLNSAIDDALGAVPENIAFSSSSVLESASSGSLAAEITSTNTSSVELTNETYTIISITDGNGTNRNGAFTVDNSVDPSQLLTGETFEFTNTNTDNYTIRIRVTDSLSNTLIQNKSISIGNVAPTITVGANITALAESVSTGTTIRTVTAVNGSAKTSANTNNLTFAITSGNTNSDFAINSSTGAITVVNSLSGGDSYNLTIQVTDAGGSTNSDTLAITVASTTYTLFYISEGDSSASSACNKAVGSDAYFIGSGVPSNTDVIYSNQQGTVFNGGGNYYAFSQDPHNGSGTSYVGQISATGVLSGATLCN